MYSFPIEEKNVAADFGDFVKVVIGKKAIVRTDTNEPIAIVGKRYKVVPNTDVVQAFEEALDALGPTFQNRTIRTYLPHNGAKMFRTYTFNAMQQNVAVGDIVKLQLELMNSYDGSMKVGYKYYALRLACTNGLMTGINLQEIHNKHFGSFDIDSLVEMLKQSVPVYEASVREWQKWQQIPMNAESVSTMLKKAVISEKIREKILIRFKEEEQSRWGFFQAATWVTSHEVVAKNEQNTRLSRFQVEGALVPIFYKAKLAYNPKTYVFNPQTGEME